MRRSERFFDRNQRTELLGLEGKLRKPLAIARRLMGKDHELLSIGGKRLGFGQGHADSCPRLPGPQRTGGDLCAARCIVGKYDRAALEFRPVDATPLQRPRRKADT